MKHIKHHLVSKIIITLQNNTIADTFIELKVNEIKTNNFQKIRTNDMTVNSFDNLRTLIIRKLEGSPYLFMSRSVLPNLMDVINIIDNRSNND